MTEDVNPAALVVLQKPETPLISPRIIGDVLRIDILPRDVDRVTVIIDGTFADKKYVRGQGSISFAIPVTKPQHIVQVIVTHVNHEQTILNTILEK